MNLNTIFKANKSIGTHVTRNNITITISLIYTNKIKDRKLKKASYVTNWLVTKVFWVPFSLVQKRV